MRVDLEAIKALIQQWRHKADEKEWATTQPVVQDASRTILFHELATLRQCADELETLRAACSRLQIEGDDGEVALIEALAAYAHDAWAGWMRHLFSKCESDAAFLDGDLAIPAEWVERWQRQVDLPYADLREDEKESDRKEARRMLAILKSAEGDRITAGGVQNGSSAEF